MSNGNFLFSLIFIIEEFSDLLNSVKLKKIIEKFKRKQQKEKKDKYKGKYYRIENYDEDTPIHYTEPNYEKLRKQKEKHLKWLSQMFKFPFEKQKTIEIETKEHNLLVQRKQKILK